MSRIVKRALVLMQCVVRISFRYVWYDFSKESMLAIRYVLMFLFSSCSLQVELHEVWLYHIFKENSPSQMVAASDTKWHPYIESTKPWKVTVPFRIICKSVHPPMLISLCTISTPSLYCDFISTKVWLFKVPISFQCITPGITRQT